MFWIDFNLLLLGELVLHVVGDYLVIGTLQGVNYETTLEVQHIFTSPALLQLTIWLPEGMFA